MIKARTQESVVTRPVSPSRGWLAALAALIIAGACTRPGHAFDKSTLAEVQLGINDNPNAYPYANIMWRGKAWRHTKQWNGVAFTLSELDDHGYPILTSGQSAYMSDTDFGFPDPPANEWFKGQHLVTWEGDADVQMSDWTNYRTFLWEDLSSTPKKRAYLFHENTGDFRCRFNLQVTAGANYATNPLRNLCIWAPHPNPALRDTTSLEPANNPCNPFHPTYIADIDKPGVGIHRYYIVMNGWQSSVVDWNQRTPPYWVSMTLPVDDNITPGTNKHTDAGWAYEYCIALSNLTNTDAWLTIPHAATDDCVRKIARLFRYGSNANGQPYTSTQANPVYPPLNSNLKVFIEYSNETWAGGHVGADYVADRATSMGITKSEFAARRSCEIWSLFQTEFGAGWQNRLVRVICTQTVSPNVTTDRLNEVFDYGPNLPSRSTEWTNPTGAYTQATQADCLGVTSYWGANTQDYALDNVPFWNLDAAALNMAMDNMILEFLEGASASSGIDNAGVLDKAHFAAAAAHGMSVIGYEGGIGLPLAGRIRSVLYPEYPKTQYPSGPPLNRNGGLPDPPMAGSLTRPRQTPSRPSK